MATNLAACEDGLIVRTPVNGRDIQFGLDAPIPLIVASNNGAYMLPQTGLFISAARQPNGDHWAIVLCADDFGDADPAKKVNACALVKRQDRSVTRLPIGYGLDACIVTRTGYVCTVDMGGHWWTKRSPDGPLARLEIPPPIYGFEEGGGTVSGFAYVEDSGAAHFVDYAVQSPLHPDGQPEIHGLRAIRLRKSGDWACFLAGDFEGVYAYHYPTDKMYVAIRGHSQVSPNICQQQDGTAIVCWPMSTPDGLMAHSSNFELIPYTPPGIPVPPVNTIPASRIACFRRPMMMTPWFTHSVQYGVTQEFIGNVAMPDKTMVDKAPTGIALIQFLNGTNSGYDGSAATIDRTLAYLIHGGNDINAIQALYQTALGYPEKPIIIYMDTRVWPTARPSWVKQDRTYLAIQTYRNQGESVASFSAVMNNLYVALRDSWKCPLMEVPAFYDRGWGQEGIDLCLGSRPVYEQLIRDHYVMGVLPFSDLRLGGMSTHKALKDAWIEFFLATPGRPNRWDYWLPTDWKKKSLSVLDYELLNARPEVRAYWKALVAKDTGVSADEMRAMYEEDVTNFPDPDPITINRDEPPAGESYPEEG